MDSLHNVHNVLLQYTSALIIATPKLYNTNI
jgi:hypothetical protein